MDNPYVDRVKVYFITARRENRELPSKDCWLSTTIFINPSMVTGILYIDSDYAVIRYNEQTYKIYRTDFDKIFEVEVL